MSDTKLQVGDVVKLKSGGPDMTVVKVLKGPKVVNNINCMWFTESGSITRGSFPEAVLVKIEPVVLTTPTSPYGPYEPIQKDWPYRKPFDDTIVVMYGVDFPGSPDIKWGNR
jgi:uncharacterized protein YodC (DUF2158 family)